MSHSTAERFPLNPATNARVVDETMLETDVSYRFDFVRDVIGLSEEDHDVLRKHHEALEPHLQGIVESVYKKMFEYESMKRHFLPRHSGFDGNVPASINELKFDHEQTEFRKSKLKEYYIKLCTAEWDETFALLLDVVGHMHTPRQGNANLQVPIVQIATLMGFMNDLFLNQIWELDLSAKSQIALQRAYTKLFWVQNSMFIQHWTR